jgi:ubiquinone/menaquinone biosynthesis C-methylase UbiE
MKSKLCISCSWHAVESTGKHAATTGSPLADKVSFRVMDAEALEYQDNVFDCTVQTFGVMFMQ